MNVYADVNTHALSSWDSRNVMDDYLDPFNLVLKTTWLAFGERKGVQGNGC